MLAYKSYATIKDPARLELTHNRIPLFTGGHQNCIFVSGCSDADYSKRIDTSGVCGSVKA